MQGLPQTFAQFLDSSSIVSTFASIVYGREKYELYFISGPTNDSPSYSCVQNRT